MIITAVAAQQKDKNRINVMVDGKYRFSLDIFQYADLGIKVGKDYSEEELIELETESQFGKIYTRTLEYCLMRPHSAKEVRDYLYRKTRTTRVRRRATGEVVERPGVPVAVTERVFARLVDKGYIDDEKFARYWVENRSQLKGASQRKLQLELRAKGVDVRTINHVMAEVNRSDSDEIQKVITKKQRLYPDRQKFIQYLMRQGFRYDDIVAALDDRDSVMTE
jgi:regulatory protein